MSVYDGDDDPELRFDGGDLISVSEQATMAATGLQDVQNAVQAILGDEPESTDIDVDHPSYPLLQEAYRLLREARAKMSEAHVAFIRATN